MNRRGFLRGLLGLAAVPVVAKVAPVEDDDAWKRWVSDLPEGSGTLEFPEPLDLPREVVDTGAVLADVEEYYRCTPGLVAYVTPWDDAARGSTMYGHLLDDIELAPPRNAAMTRELLSMRGDDVEQAVCDYAAAWRGKGA